MANRGEIAVRVIRAAQELGLGTVAVHAADESHPAHAAGADLVVALPGSGPRAYLDIEAVVAAAVSTGATAVHPGYGFLSENPELARQCAGAGLVFVGPRADVLELLADKVRARTDAVRAGIPVLPGTDGPTTAEQARAFLAEHGAMMLKALAGGGGRGMRPVRDPAELDEAFQRCTSEARAAFGDGALYAEVLLDRPRHLEVQVVGDGTGAVTHLGERDCSIQRRHQKVIELAPSPWLTDAMRTRLTDAATRLAAGVRLDSLATVEFLVAGESMWFLEANPRIQVEHPVTEEVTGVDLVRTQLRLAAGATLAELGLTTPPPVRGVAIEVRVNAETLGADSEPLPGSGTLRRFQPPCGPGIRVDTAGAVGQRVDPRFDPLLAKVVVRGPDLGAAVARARRAVADFEIAGVPTSLDVLHGILSVPGLLDQPWDTGFLTRHAAAVLAHRRPSAGAPGGPASGAGAAAGVAEEPTGSPAPSGPAHPDPAHPDAVAVTSPLPGIVIRIDAEPGTLLAAGQPVAVVEAMKMEHVVRASETLVVDAVLTAPGDVVDVGAVIVHGTRADAQSDAGPGAPDPDDDDWSAEVAEIVRRAELARRMGGAEKVARQHAEGKLTARERVDAIADEGSFTEIGVLAGFATYDDSGDAQFTAANFVAGTARIDGRPVVLGVDDFTLRAGSGDAAIHAKQVFAEEYARDLRLPVVRLLDGASGGGSVAMVQAAGYAYVPVNPAWDAVVENLSLVPVVAAALGPTVGLGAARLVMSHLSVMVEGIGQVFTAGPPVVLGGTGERLTKEELGGVDIHRANGTVERIVPDEATAFAVIRQFLSYLPSSVFQTPPVTHSDDPAGRRDEHLLRAVPRNPRRPYDIEPVLAAVFDRGSVLRYADYGGGTVTALARLDGHPVGVIAADPTLGATMSAAGALAVTRLVDLCETFHLPIVSLTDQAGMTIGTSAERAATIRHGARAITAVYQARVPQAEIILRRVYGVGGAGIVNRHRSTRSWAWPSGDWGSLPAKGGIEAAFRSRLAVAADPGAELARLSHELESLMSPFRTAERFGVQDIIDPRNSRALLCEWVRDAYRVIPEQTGRPAFGTRP